MYISQSKCSRFPCGLNDCSDLFLTKYLLALLACCLRYMVEVAPTFVRFIRAAVTPFHPKELETELRGSFSFRQRHEDPDVFRGRFLNADKQRVQC